MCAMEVDREQLDALPRTRPTGLSGDRLQGARRSHGDPVGGASDREVGAGVSSVLGTPGRGRAGPGAGGGGDVRGRSVTRRGGGSSRLGGDRVVIWKLIELGVMTAALVGLVVVLVLNLARRG
jgi:hypothetical protein